MLTRKQKTVEPVVGKAFLHFGESFVERCSLYAFNRFHGIIEDIETAL